MKKKPPSGIQTETFHLSLFAIHGLSGSLGKLLRNWDVEPVIGQIKTRGSFSQFLLRGVQKVRIEWKIGAIAHNLLKIISAVKREREISICA
jgi:hypothetical protein